MPRDKNIVFDLECYPNLFTNTCKEFGKDRIRQFVIWHDPNGTGEAINQLEEMIAFILQEVKRFIGYNNLSYDNLLLNFLLCNREVLIKSTSRRINEELVTLSGNIIGWLNSRKRNDKEVSKEVIQQMHTLVNMSFFSSLDLIAQFNTIDRTGLKQVAINMRWHNVQDLPFPPGSVIRKDQIQTVLDYNLNDVFITEEMLQQRSKVILLRDQISKRYEVDVFNANDTDIGKTLLSKYYLEETKMPHKQFTQGRSFYTYIDLKDCITRRSVSQLYSREGEMLIKALRKARIDPNSEDRKKQFEYTYRSRYVTHNIALGGIHSINPPEIIKEDDDHYLLDIDVSGYYGSLIVEEGLYPRHLGPVFTRVYEDKIHIPKLQAKAKGDTVAADTLKISSNAIYGLTKSKHSPFYDPRMTLTVCISGQLYLLSLIEAIENNTGAMIVYANTDGLRIRLPKSEYNAVRQICKLWEQYTGFELTYKQLRKIILKDVNNYLLFTYSEDKPIIAAGDFREQRPINKGYDYPVIPTALNSYYEKGIPVEDTINNCTNLFLYMKAERIDEEKFYAEMHQRKGSVLKLQKHNRWIVTDGNPEEGKLYKVDHRPEHHGKTEEMQKGYFTTVANQLPKDDIPDPDWMRVNYSFYINEALKIVNIIKPSLNQSHVRLERTQLKMF
jgi:hypothetical protein